MRQSLKSALGVTLLEIMLVLAIAAMVIVMSIRYYQNATNSQNANLVLEQIQNIAAAADNLAIGTSSYSAITTSSLTSVVGASNMKTPYGQSITFTSGGAGSPTTYSVSIPGLPTAVCQSVYVKLKANTKYQNSACASGTVSYTYNSVN